MWTKISGSQRCRAAAMLMIGLASAPPASAYDKFSLAKAIPDDVFIASVERHNPEREFLEKYWGEVWDAFMKSGVIEDGLELALSALDDEQGAELNRIKDRFTELFAAGDWKALGSGQVAFGERFAARKSGELGSVAKLVIGPPDFVMMFRNTDEIAEKNFNAMTGILKAAVEEINSAANEELQIEQSERHKADLIARSGTPS